MTRSCRGVVVAAAIGLAALLLAAAPARAQGRGKTSKNASAPGHATAVDPITQSPATPASRSVYLGSWLDDASVIGAGALWAALSMTVSEGGQFDFPIVDMAFGTTPRTQAGVSVPISRLDDGSGNTSTTVGTAFFHTKFRLRDAAASDGRLGVAIAPLVAISRADADGSQQVSLGVPVNLEVRDGPVRVYGSAGFFTRGALFASAALEVTASRRLTVTGTVGHTYASGDLALDTAGLHRTDVGAGASYGLSGTISMFGAAGRSATSDAAGKWLAAGLSLFVAR